MTTRHRKPAKSLPGPKAHLEKWLSEESAQPRMLADLTKQIGLTRVISEKSLENILDNTWKGGDEPNSEKGKLALRMMQARIRILTEVSEEFCALATNLAWPKETMSRAAAVLIPFFDVAERACYTYYGHQYRSMQYAKIILDERGFDGEQRSWILLGTLLHDIGKIGIPGTLLRQAGKPKEKEFAVVKEHTGHGKLIIESLMQQLCAEGSTMRVHGDAIAGIVEAHHEKFGGGGYPKGTVGEAIDIGARVAALCDSIDAMSSKRIYRLAPAATYEEIVARANDEMDEQFNKNLVANFLDAAKNPHILERIYDLIRSAGGVP